MWKKWASKVQLPGKPTQETDEATTTEDSTNVQEKKSQLPSSEQMSAAASVAASSMMGFMKKAQSAATTMVKEGQAKAVDLKNKAALVADMDALQERLASALDVKAAEVDVASLNFTYVTDNLIAMGFPGSNNPQQGTPIRYNPIDAVSFYLNDNHRGKYMIWNLSEEPYEYSKFDDQVLEFKFPGHPAPPLGLLFKICTSIENWLEADPANVAVVHCLTGKGRTGIVLACYLAWVGKFESPMEALLYVCQKRSIPLEKLSIPSQRRYVQYFTNMLDGVKPRSSPLLLRRVIMNTIPVFAKRRIAENEGTQAEVETSGCCPYLQIFKAGKLVFTTTWKDADNGTGVKWASESEGSMSFPVECLLQGDILIRCRHLSDSGKRVSMFRAAFHTGYIPMGILRLTKPQLDGAVQDVRFADDFFIDLIFAPVQADQEGEDDSGKRMEGVAISPNEKQAYDDMLDRDEQFWMDIADRKKRLASTKKLSTTNHTQNAFSIDLGEAPAKPAVVNQASQGSTESGGWGDDQDAELLLQLESVEEKSSSPPPAPATSDPFAEFTVTSTPPAPVATAEAKEEVPAGTERALDLQINELSQLESELGLEAFSEELKKIPSPSDLTAQSTEDTLNFLEDDLADLTESLDLSSTDVPAASPDLSSLDLDDDFDELEEYLKKMTK